MPHRDDVTGLLSRYNDCYILHFVLQLEFDAWIREPNSTKMWHRLHLAISLTYKYTMLTVYHILVILFGLIVAVTLAIINGIGAFCHIWLWGPFLKIILTFIYSIAPLCTKPFCTICTSIIRVLRQLCAWANPT